MKKVSLLITILYLSMGFVFSQIQIGNDIDGEDIADFSGIALSMPDANTVAIGAPNNDGNGESSGHVRVYEWNGSEWIQKGSDIDGEAADDESGRSVSMPDANTIAIGAYQNTGIGGDGGHVRIYEWNDSIWFQKGLDIDGEDWSDESGYSVSMPDANTVAIGSPEHNGLLFDSGHVRVFTWESSEWIQKGSSIEGEAAIDWSGHSVSMPDTNTLAIGTPYNDGNGENSGHVRIYEWNGLEWIQKGSDIDGEASQDWSGNSVSMPDANTIAIGAPFNNGNGENSGHARIFEWNGSEWIQKGFDIDGEAANDNSGMSVSMPDANTIAIGAPNAFGEVASNGHTRIFGWNGSDWIQKGVDIDGEIFSVGIAGFAVSMPDSITLAIGNPYNNGNGSSSGHVRVYSLCVDVSIINDSPTLLASPENEMYQWVNCDNNYSPLDEEINQSFIPTNSGNYAVIISQAGCVDTTLCEYVYISSILENRFRKDILLFPNPTNGNISIDLVDTYPNVEVIVRNIIGQEIQYENYESSRLIDLVIEGPNGVYYIDVISEDEKAIFRIVKN